MTSCGRDFATSELEIRQSVSGIDADLSLSLSLSLSPNSAHNNHTRGWWRGVVVSGVRRMNEVNALRARLLPGWVTVFVSPYVTSQLGQLSLR